MDEGKIYITISDERKGGGGSGNGGGGLDQTPITPQQENPIENDNMMGIAKHLYYGNVINTAKSIVNFTMGNIGNFTGDYNTQRQINAMKGITGDFISIGVGFTAGGAVGGIIAGIGVAVKHAEEYMTDMVSNTKQNHEIAQLREISGLNALTNGSR